MSWATRGLWVVIAILGIVALQLGTLKQLGHLAGPHQTLIVDAKAVVRIFIEERGQHLSEEALRDAIRDFDRLVMAEAQAIHAETGALLINANHILAGGIEISDAFAARVIARWDQIQ
ncbi:MAG: hypothetical protein P8L68_19335 [Paracoccaceae bacterium]|nr:hypothetical protein [Paracoccaceae bacterium]MDG1736562.1 hypothetical protein [Paracoccaceae bacterium]MDG2260631.1 hypothetical protein [Paracoccaceae bacterium]